MIVNKTGTKEAEVIVNVINTYFCSHRYCNKCNNHIKLMWGGDCSIKRELEKLRWLI